MNEFTIDKKQVRRAFSRAAPEYDASAVLQREVCTRMQERLDYVKLQPSMILDAGCGTGFGARELLTRYPAARVAALDIAMGMLGASSAGAGDAKSRLDHVCADIEALPLAADSADMIWSNLALQWCNDLPAALRGFSRVLRTDGLLMFSTFGPDTLKELRSAFGGASPYSHVSRFADMHDLGDMLLECGFAEPVMDMEIFTLTYADVKAVMRDLRAIGAANATLGRLQGMMGRKTWARMTENYERFRNEGRLPATFEVVYGHAWKPKARDTEHPIRMDFMR